MAWHGRVTDMRGKAGRREEMAERLERVRLGTARASRGGD